VFHTRTAIERRVASANPLLPLIKGNDPRVVSTEQQARYVAERALDQVLADSFPASDPPSWTLGIARPEPLRLALTTESEAVALNLGEPVDVSPPHTTGRRFLQRLTSLVGATGMALLFPVVILLIGLPVALVVRGIAEAIAWLLGRIVG
jgi:hypothetical protein